MLRALTQTSAVAVTKLNAHVRLPLFRNAYALMITTATTSGLGLLYWILAARYYPPEIVGLNAALISTLTFLAGITQLPFMNALLRFIPIAGRSTGRLVRRSYLISMLGATAIGVLFLLTVNAWTPVLGFLRKDLWLSLWFLLSVVAWCVFALQDNVLTGLREAIYVPLDNIPYALVKLWMLVWLAERLTDYGILASWTLPLILFLLPINYLIFRHLIPRHMRAAHGRKLEHSIGQIAYYIGGNSVGALFLLAVTRLLPLLVANQAGSLANAYFYLPWTITSSLKLIAANMGTSFTVEVATDTTKLRSYSYRFLVHTTSVLIVPVLLMVAGAPYILSISRADYVAEGTRLLRLLSLAVLPNIVISLYLGIARVRQRVLGIIVVQGALCVVTLGLGYVLLSRYGIAGIGVAVLVTESLLALALLCTALRPIILAPLWLRACGGLRAVAKHEIR